MWEQMHRRELERAPDYRVYDKRVTKSTLLMLALAVATAALVVWHLAGPQTASAGWHRDVNDAVEAATGGDKPVFVLFSADWCASCQKLETGALSDPKVAEHLRDNWVLARVDLTDRDAPGLVTARRHQVRAVPTLIAFDPRGDELARISGAVDAGRLLTWLHKWHQASASR